MKISVNCPSYKRPKVETLDYLPFCKVWVCETEYEAYKEANPGAEIISCAKGIQGNCARIRNHILDTEFANGADVVVMVDDDIKYIARFEPETGTTYGYQKHKLKADDFMEFVEKYSVLCDEFGFKYWGINCCGHDKQSYYQQTPFSTKVFIGGVFQCFLRGNVCRYDERIPLKEDYDMCIQNANTYRGYLRVNKYYYEAKQSYQTGGCAAYRNTESEREQFELLQKKWGSDIVKRDSKNNAYSNAKKEKVMDDYNPIIKIPIKGV